MPRSLRKSISGFFRNTKPPTDDVPPPLPTTPLPSLIAETQRLSFVETPPKPSKPAVKPTRPAQLITPEMLRELRETIRLKYALDIEIWRQRDAKSFASDRREENIKRSKAALERIRKTLTAWDRKEYFKTPQEHAKFQEIKRRLMEGEKADWTQKPPREFAYHGGNPYDGRMEADGQPINSAERLALQGHGQVGGPHRPNGGPGRPNAGQGRPVGEAQEYTGRPQKPNNAAPRPGYDHQGLFRGLAAPESGGRHPRHTRDASAHSTPPRATPTHNTPTHGTPTHATPMYEVPANHASRHSTPLNITPRSFSDGQRPLQEVQRLPDAYRSPKYRVASPVDSHHTHTPSNEYRVPPPPPPTEGVRSPSMRVPTPFDGNGTPVITSPEPNIRSRRSTMDAQRRVTEPPEQWQNVPVEYARKEEVDMQDLRSRFNKPELP